MNNEKCSIIRDLIADVLNDENNKELLGGDYDVMYTDAGLALSDQETLYEITVSQVFAAAEKDREIDKTTPGYILGEKVDDILIGEYSLVIVDGKYLYDNDVTDLFGMNNIKIIDTVDLQKFHWNSSTGCIEGDDFDSTKPIMDVFLEQAGNRYVCKGYCRKTDAGDDLFFDLDNVSLAGSHES